MFCTRSRNKLNAKAHKKHFNTYNVLNRASIDESIGIFIIAASLIHTGTCNFNCKSSLTFLNHTISRRPFGPVTDVPYMTGPAIYWTMLLV